MIARTLYDKLWELHTVHVEEDGTTLLYIDRHLVHEVTSPQAFEGMKLARRKPWRISANLAVADHNVPTTDRSRGIADPVSRLQVDTLDTNCAEYGIVEFKMNDARQGIVHVIGPEQGATLPGMTVVCGDSHTSTHGAFACLAFGIGTSEVEHVLSTQCLLAKKMKNMLVRVEGPLARGVTAKDAALAVIGRIGIAGGTGCTIEYAGGTVRSLTMEGRMTLCNMSIEAGARAGLVAVDEVTLAYLKGRPFAPRGELWDRAVAHWRTLKSDPDAKFDHEVTIDARSIKPGHLPRNGRHRGRARARSRRGEGRKPPGGHGEGAHLHGLEAQYSHDRHPHRQGVHRLVHELAHRGPAGRRRDRPRAPTCRERQARNGRAGIGPGESAGRARGP